jgi:hypothetical protein
MFNGKAVFISGATGSFQDCMAAKKTGALRAGIKP